MKAIIERISANLDHAEENADKMQKILEKCSNRDLLKVIMICQANYLEWTDNLQQLSRCGIPDLEDAITKCNTKIQYCNVVKLDLEKMIKEEEEIDKRKAFLASLKAEKLA